MHIGMHLAHLTLERQTVWFRFVCVLVEYKGDWLDSVDKIDHNNDDDDDDDEWEDIRR